MGRGLVHFLASDAHDTQWRTTALDESRQYVDRGFGREAGLRLFEENPRSALAGVPLTAVPLPVLRKPWYAFWYADSLPLTDQGCGTGNQLQFLAQLTGLPCHFQIAVGQQAQRNLALRPSRAAPG